MDSRQSQMRSNECSVCGMFEQSNKREIDIIQNKLFDCGVLNPTIDCLYVSMMYKHQVMKSESLRSMKTSEQSDDAVRLTVRLALPVILLTLMISTLID